MDSHLLHPQSQSKDLPVRATINHADIKREIVPRVAHLRILAGALPEKREVIDCCAVMAACRFAALSRATDYHRPS